MENVILLFGGKSCEHDISIISAMQVLENIDKNKFNVFPIYIDKNNVWWSAKNETISQNFIHFSTKKHKQVFIKTGTNNLCCEGKLKTKILCKINSAIICCHGLFGEDGKLQGLLELSGIPFSSCGTTSSALCMDKVFMKQIFEANNLPVCKYCFFYKQEFLLTPQKIFQTIKQQLEFPLIVKPSNLGSSIGITICKDLGSLKNAMEYAFKFDKKVVVEEVVEHLREINCAVLGDDENIIISQLDEPTKTSQFYNFSQKYLEKNIKSIKNKEKYLPKYIKNEIKSISKIAFKIFDCKGVVRIDFLYNDETEELFISEINSIPGSLSHFMFKEKSFSSLIENLISIAHKEKNKSESYVKIFESSVLEKPLHNAKK